MLLLEIDIIELSPNKTTNSSFLSATHTNFKFKKGNGAIGLNSK